MTRGGALGVAVLVLGLLLGLVTGGDLRGATDTSFGTGPGGQRALYELLEELGVAVARSFEPPALLPQGGAVWWIEPEGLCEPAAEGAAPESRGLEAFVASGGTALVFLPGRPTLLRPSPAPGCDTLAGVALPARVLAEGASAPDEGPEAGRAPAPDEEPEAAGAPARLALGPRAEAQTVSGTLVSQPRELAVPRLARFEDAGALRVAARVDGEPFALSHPLGAGRLVVVADATFLRNAWIDGGDAALLAVDLVRGFGAPRIDEHAHGLRLDRHPAAFLAELGALPVFLAAVALGLLLLWRAAAVPPAALSEAEPAPPALAAFVDGLARLYVRTRDEGRVLEHYRRLSLERIRVHFGLPPGTPAASLVLRLRREGRASPEALALLAGGAGADAKDTWEAARRLDALVLEVCR